MSIWTVVAGIGRLLVTLGALVLLFVVYLLWGTTISEVSHQRALRSEFEHALSVATHPQSSSSSPTTVASSLVKELVAGSAPSDGQPIAVLQIPKIGLDKVVVQGTSTDDLHLGPGHYTGTPLPGQDGNVGIAGHRTTYGAPFFDLNELTTGDTVELTTLQGHFTYSVVRNFVVSPSDNAVLDTSSIAMLTLTTCNPRFSASQRLVVQADLTSAAAPTPASSSTSTSPSPSASTSTSATKFRSDNLAGGQGPWAGALEWGVACLALALGAWLLARRRARGLAHYLTYAGAVIPMLVLLYFFFENLSPLLPASY